MSQSKSVTAYLKAKDSGFTSTFSKASSMLGKLSGQQKSATGTSRGFLGSIKSVAVGMGVYKVAASAVNLVTSKVTNAFGRIDTMSNFNRTMNLLKFSSAETKTTMEALKVSTKGTAYGLDVATKSAQNFITRGLQPEEATKSVSIWMDAVSTFGKGTNEELANVTDALAKMRTKGSVEMDQLNRLFDVGIDAVGMYAKATGKSAAEVQEALSKKEISTEQFLEVVETAMREGTNGVTQLAGAAKEAGAIWAGTFDNMGAAVTRGVVAMIEKFDTLTETITGTSLKGWVTRFGEFMENKLTGIADSVGNMVTKALPYINKFKGMIDSIKGPVSSAVNAVKSSLAELYGKFDQAASIQRFGGIMDTVGSKITQFANFVEKNSDKIAELISKLPKLLAGFMALKAVSSVTRTIAGFGAEVTDVLAKVFGKAHNLDVSWATNVLNPLIGAINSGKGTVSNLMGVFGLSVQESFDASMATINPNKYTSMFKALGDGISYTFPKFSQFASAVTHPATSLQTLASKLSLASATAGGSGTVIHGAALKIGSGLKGMALTGVGAIKSLGAAMLANPITAALVAIAGAVAFVAVSWKSNFMNIQGVVKTFGSNIGNSLKSMGNMFKGLEPMIKPLGSALKGLGKVLTGAVGVGIALVVDGLRTMVFGISSALKAVQALGQGISGIWKKIKGDSKGSDESFKAMKKSIDSIGDGFDNLKSNSALGAIPKAMDEWGKKTDQVKAKFTMNTEAMTQSAQEFGQTLTDAGSKLQEAFVTDESSDRVKKYYDSALSTLERYQSQRLATTEKYNELMQSAEGKSEEERRAIAIQASEMVMSDTQKANTGILTLHQNLTDQLRENKNLEGQELSEEQRAAIREQNDIIRQGLMEQNQLYVDAAMQKLANGERLSQQEMNASVANITALYNNQKEQITSNEEQIAELRKAANEAQDEVTKLNYEAQIEALKTHNEGIKASQVQQGEELLEVLLNGNEANSQAVLQGLQGRNDITNDQLGQIFQAFVNSGQDIDQQLFLLGGIMEQRGMDGSNKLVQALKTGDLSLVGGELTAEMEVGLNGLPTSMFWNGDVGKQAFIRALKTGENAEAAGKYLVDSADTGMKTGSPKSKKAADDTVDAYTNEFTNKKPEAEKGGKELGTASADGTKSTKDKHKSAGSGNAKEYNSGITSQKGNATSAGKELANASKTGASSVSFTSVGSQMAAGVASGIRAGQADAVSAMVSLVAAVNEEAKKKAEINSPSRLLKRDVGFGLPEGVAVGIREKTKLAVAEARNMIQNIHSAMTKGNDLDVISANGRMVVTGEVKQSDSAVVVKLDELIRLLKGFDLQMILDTGQLVGGLAPGMNQNLGDQTGYDRRYR